MKRFMLVLLVFIGIASSCTEDFSELNSDPTNLTEDGLGLSTFSLAFSQSLYGGMQHTPLGLTSWFPSNFQTSQALFPDLYAQYHATTSEGFDSDVHVIEGGWNNATWNAFYATTLPQLDFVEQFTEENDLPIENAIVKVYRVFSFSRITDFYGPIPFSEAGNGETTVAYDSQETVYKEFFLILDDAVQVLKENTGKTSIYSTNDAMYDGNVDHWLAFANSLRLRLALRIKYADTGLAKSEAEKAVSDGVMTSNNQNGYLLVNASSKNAYNLYTAWGEFRMSASMESILKGYDDPRIGVYYSPAENGDQDGDGIPYEGILNGQSKPDKASATLDFNANSSNMGPKWLPDTQGETPIFVMRAAESYFLRAEGALEGWAMGGSPNELYDEGIRTSFAEFELGSAEGYIASSNTPADLTNIHPMGNLAAASIIPVSFEVGGSSETQLEQIITQKWLSLYPDSWESWAEVRRTGYPKLFSRLNSNNLDVPADQLVRRLLFPSQEYDTNGEAVNKALSLPEMSAGDKASTKLWWDKK